MLIKNVISSSDISLFIGAWFHIAEPHSFYPFYFKNKQNLKIDNTTALLTLDSHQVSF